MCNEWNINPPPTLTFPTNVRFQGKDWNNKIIWYHIGMASVEISLLTGLKPQIISYICHHFSIVPFPPLCNYRDMVTILIRRTIQRTVESFPELLPAVAASASVWGSGSLQVLELTPASPVSTCTRWPLPWDQRFCGTSGSTSQAHLFNDNLRELTRILLILVWIDESTLSLGSPEHFTQDHL